MATPTPSHTYTYTTHPMIQNRGRHTPSIFHSGRLLRLCFLGAYRSATSESSGCGLRGSSRSQPIGRFCGPTATAGGAPAADVQDLSSQSHVTSTGQSPRSGGNGALGTRASVRERRCAVSRRRRGGGGGRSRRACRGRRAWSRPRGRG